MAKKKKDKTIDEEVFGPYLKELRLAYKRIGSSPTRRLDWLLRFAYEDLSSLSAGQLVDRKWELVMFAAEGAKPEELERLNRRPRGVNYPQMLLASRDAPLGGDFEFFRSFQEKMKANFQAYYSKEGWHHKRSAAEGRIVFDAPEFYQAKYTGSYPGAVDFLVDISWDLLTAEFERMRRCERCKKPFVEKRKGRARFCSRQCSAYVKLKNWREKSKAK